MPLRIVQVQDGDIRIIDSLGNIVSDNLENLDVTLASRASELTLLSIKSDTVNLDSPLSVMQFTLDAIEADTDNLDVPLSTRLSKADFEARINTLGQKTMANSTPIVIASNQTPIPITNTPFGSRTGVSSTYMSLGGGTSGSLFPLRATSYVEPAAAGQRSVVSSNANDTAAGTGARTIRITYFDNTGAGPFTEDVTLAGLLAVNTAAVNIQFIEKIEVLTVGSGGANAGTISLYTGLGGAGTVIGSIGVGNILAGVGDNQTLWAHHYAPTAYTAQIATFTVSIQSGGAGTAGRFAIRTFYPLVANSVEKTIDGALLVSGAFRRAYDYHTLIPGFVRFTGYVIPSVNNTTISASFDWAEQP